MTLRQSMPNAKCQMTNAKWQMPNDECHKHLALTW
jgi:hypothetical protein